jgi:steroid delta-isomerase-like uncharacterized protein
MDAASAASECMEAFNKRDWDRMSAVLSPDVTYSEKGSNRNTKGIDGIMQVARDWDAAFPDLHGNITLSANCGTTAVLEITWTGTNTGPLQTANGTLPATGRSVEFEDAQVYTVENDKVVSFRNYGDFLTMLTQLGLLPS